MSANATAAAATATTRCRRDAPRVQPSAYALTGAHSATAK